jgi:tetratricopeptide (TPR) repeat protein
VGEYDSAVEHFETAVDCSKRLGDHFNPTPARNLAVCLDRAGRHEEARPIYEQLLSDLKGLEDFGRDRAQILFDLAKNLGESGDRDDCIAAFNEAIDATISVNGEETEQLAEIYESLATYYGYEVFDYSSAADFMRKAANLYEKLFGLTDERTMDARSELSEFLSGLGHVREARMCQGATNEVGESKDSYDDDPSISPMNPSPTGLPKRKPRRVLN